MDDNTPTGYRYWYIKYDTLYKEHEELKHLYEEQKKQVEMLLAELSRINRAINSISRT